MNQTSYIELILFFFLKLFCANLFVVHAVSGTTSTWMRPDSCTTVKRSSGAWATARRSSGLDGQQGSDRSKSGNKNRWNMLKHPMSRDLVWFCWCFCLNFDVLVFRIVVIFQLGRWGGCHVLTTFWGHWACDQLGLQISVMILTSSKITG